MKTFDLFLGTLWPKYWKLLSIYSLVYVFSPTNIYLQLHIHFRLVSDFKVSSRNILGIFYIVACNYSRLVIIPVLSSGIAVGPYLLQDYNSQHYQTSIQHRPNLWARPGLLFALIVTAVKALWPNKEIYILIHISKTTNSIFNCSTPPCSPWLTLNFK